MSTTFWLCMLFFALKGTFWAVPMLWKQAHPGDRFAAVYIATTAVLVGCMAWS